MEKQTADMILENGRFYLGGETPVFAEATAIQGRWFLLVGTREECRAVRGQETTAIDLQGNVVLPGLLDGHTHPVTIAKTI